MNPFLRGPLPRPAFSFAAVMLTGLIMAQHARPTLPPSTTEQPFATGSAQASGPRTALYIGHVENSSVTTAWGNKVVRSGARNHGLPAVNAIKDAKLPAKLTSARPGKPSPPSSPKAITPSIGSNFEANWSTNQTPPDNSMAISNGGWIVSANNDGILYYGTDGTASFGAFWADFFSGQGLNANIYDPKVLYDSQADRFFMVVLHGSDAASSIVLLCFSETNNPNDGWNIYQLPGNVLNNNCWFDYPCIGVSNNEVYVTGNLFTSGNNQFDQSVVFQVQKSGGYAGAGSLNWQYWYGLTSDIGAFTVVPSSWGQSGTYGPGILLVSDASGGDNRYILWDLTDDLTGSPQLNAYTVNVAGYSPAADAQMPGNADLLDNGDCRIMGTFYLNGIVHCIHHGDVGNGWNGIYYSRINISNLSVNQEFYGDPGVIDISYPQLTSFSTSTSDHGVMIAYLQSSSQVFPEVQVVNCDNAGNFGASTLVKDGDTFVDFVQGEDRWGDYTGMSRRHNATEPEVWLAGCYGANVQGVLNNTWKTWIAQVGDAGVGLAGSTPPGEAVRLFPSPAVDLFNLVFTVGERATHRVTLTDMNGSLVKLLFEGGLVPGENRLVFNRAQLSAGRYIVTVSSNDQIIAHETLVVE